MLRIRARDNDGDTPLYVAEVKLYVELSYLLLERGTNATTQAGHGRAPIHITSDKVYREPPHLLPGGGTTNGTAQSDEGSTSSQVGTAEGYAELASPLPEPGR